MNDDAGTTHDHEQPAGISRRKALTGLGAAGAVAWAAPAVLTLDAAAAAGSDPDLVDSYVLSTDIAGARWLGGFERANPLTYRSNKKITGLVPGDDLKGIDFRPLTGDLYGVARRSSTGELVLYIITTPSTSPTAVFVAVASSAGGPVRLTDDLERLGVDFNPTVDRLRVVTTGRQNFRINPANGVTLIDAPLVYAGADVNAGETPSVSGAAYTNNAAGAAVTVLFDIDAATEALVRQAPPNNGTLNTVGSVGLPAPGAQTLSGFDIVTEGGVGGRDVAYAVYRLGGVNTIYSVDLLTGGHTPLGALGSGGLAGGPVFPNLEGLAIRS